MNNIRKNNHLKYWELEGDLLLKELETDRRGQRSR